MAGRAQVGSVAALEKLTPRQPVMCFRERSMTRLAWPVTVVSLLTRAPACGGRKSINTTRARSAQFGR